MKESAIINTFVHEYMITTSEDTYHLACFITGLVKAVLHNAESLFPTYDQFNNLMMERKHKLCKKEMKMQCVYLYVLIKCVQTKLFGKNMFGSFSKKELIEMIF